MAYDGQFWNQYNLLLSAEDGPFPYIGLHSSRMWRMVQWCQFY